MTPKGPAEAATNNGYATDLVAILTAKGLPLRLENIACPGETIKSFIDGGDACTPLTSQLSRAESFLRDNSQETGIVTIDVGFNNIRPCLQFAKVDEKCVATAVALIKRELPQALKGLKAAAGRRVAMVGLLYGDPFLGHYLNSTLGRANALTTLHDVERMDAALDAVFQASGVAVAPVESALMVNDVAMTGHFDGRTVPQNVAMVCQTTWMCRTAPWGPNEHPDNLGYSIIARAIAHVLPSYT
jgi:hypothetical protein